MPSFSKPSKLSSKTKSLFARSSPIVLISEPTGLVVNSVRHLPNGDPILPEWNREYFLEYARTHAHEYDAVFYRHWGVVIEFGY